MAHPIRAGLVLILVFLLAACSGGGGGGGGNVLPPNGGGGSGGGGGGTGGGGTNPLAVESAVFRRPNALGGHSLLVAPTAGTTVPRVVADHGASSIRSALPALAATRVVYRVRDIFGSENLWGVPLTAPDATQARPLTNLLQAELLDIAVVQDRWVVFEAYMPDISQTPILWRADATVSDVTSLQRLSSPGAEAMNWRPDWVAADGSVYFEETVAGAAAVWAVAPTATLEFRRVSRNGAASARMLGPLVDRSPFVAGTTPLVEHSTVAGVTFVTVQCSDAPATEPRVLVGAIPADELAPGGVIQCGVSNGSLCYVRTDYGTANLGDERQNVFAVRLDGGDGFTPRNLSQLVAPGSFEPGFFSAPLVSLRAVADDRIYWTHRRAVSQDDYYDLYAGNAAAAQLTPPVRLYTAFTPYESFISFVPLAGARVAVGRNTQNGLSVCAARADVAESLQLLDVLGFGFFGGLPIAGDGAAVVPGSWATPTAQRAFVTDADAGDLYRLVANGTAWSYVACNVGSLTAVQFSPEAYWQRRGNRILYRTADSLRSFDPDNPTVQSTVLGAAVVDAFRGDELAGASAGAIFFDTTLGFFRARCDASFPGNVQTIHTWAAGEILGSIAPFNQGSFETFPLYPEAGGRVFFGARSPFRSTIRVARTDSTGSADVSQSSGTFDQLLGCYTP